MNTRAPAFFKPRRRSGAALLWPATSGLLLAAWPCMAQQPATDEPRRLDTITVTATRQTDDPRDVPAAIEVLDAPTLRRAQPQLQLTEALQRVPGVAARDRQNQAQDVQLSIRGFGARATFGVRGLRLYSDGIPATMPDGQGQVSHFALESAARIEVLRGPYSALYGNAAGGVISVFTADAPTQPTLGVAALAGSDGLRRGSLAWATTFGEDDRHGVLLDASHTEGAGFRDHSASRRRAGQGLLRGEFGAQGRYTLLLNTLDLRADDPQGLTAQQARETPRAASAGALAFDTRKTVRQTQAGLRVEHPLGERQLLAATLWRGSRDTFQMLSVPVAAQADPLSGGGAIDLAREYGGIDARWQWQGTLAGDPVTLTLGAQQETAQETRRGFENFRGTTLGVVGALRRDEDNRVRGRDAYAQLDWQPHPRWRLNLGARRSAVAFRTRDHYLTPANPDDSGTLEYASTSPVAGALYRARPWLGIFANVGRGFETPTFAELAYRGDGLSGLNSTLRPARSRNLEMGVRAQRDAWQASVTAFDIRTRDELAVASNSGGRSVFANTGDTRRRGLEAAGMATLSPAWSVSGAYTWLDAAYRNDERRIPGIARRSAWTELRWSPRATLDVMLQAQANSSVFADDANTAWAAGFVHWDLAAERRWTMGAYRLRGFARIDNLLDRQSVGSVIVNEANRRYFEPAPGRTWVLGLRVERTLD